MSQLALDTAKLFLKSNNRLHLILHILFASVFIHLYNRAIFKDIMRSHDCASGCCIAASHSGLGEEAGLFSRVSSPQLTVLLAERRI